MASGEKQGGERRDSTRHQIRKLLDERRQMFALYGRLVEGAPFREALPDPARIQVFCEILIDYVAAGHFGLYRRFTEGRERRRDLVRLAADIYPAISATTEVAVDFNDRYVRAEAVTDREGFARDLSSLGELLDKRAELEDRLVEAMLPPARR